MRFAWGKSAWIDDAVRRLITASLTPDDLQDLAALAKSHHGLPTPEGLAPTRLDAATLPSSAQAGVDVSLIAFRSPAPYFRFNFFVNQLPIVWTVPNNGLFGGYPRGKSILKTTVSNQILTKKSSLM